MVMLVGLAHWLIVGVKVYVVVVVLSIAGDQTPAYPLFETVGKAPKGLP